MPQPMRQPVMAYVLDTPLTTSVRPASSGATRSSGVGFWLNQISSYISSHSTSTCGASRSTAANARSSSAE
ncbi:hypothetical protein D3C71_2066040 [compost metagenome]